ncbi:AAA family ATPase [Sphingomonas abaci]|uniref:Putative ATPase n=1 Tax=Sphingomonas abaci TaxID=237611 RepID=A0A7W7AGR2_9SPHN|nr:ATP-binding protein [Sphingomonas abaci]MBB4616734.1 putative ATPase [Sphingomonas abaci]
MQGFRLLRAAGTFENASRAKDAGHQANAPSFMDVEFAPVALSDTNAWVSVVIGRNGVGKSRLLAGVADVLERLDSGRRFGRFDSPGVSMIEYLLDGVHCRVELNARREIKATLDGVQCSAESLPLPGKIIALTTTPFDKFRLSRSLRSRPDDPAYWEEQRYSYLGLRDRTGRASPTAAMFRALEGLFGASKGSDRKRMRIAEVFELLGYQPQIEVRYRAVPGATTRFKRLIEGDDFGDLFETRSTIRSSRPFERLHEDRDEFEAVREIAQEFADRMDQQRQVVLRADFQGVSDDEFFNRIQRLRRVELVHLSSVEVRRISDGAILDLRLASSGELGIATGFLGLASTISDNSLVFIDEPEISLHPEWQKQYIDLLTKTFENFTGCHFVLATHSPLILSDIDPKASNVVSLDPERRRAESAADYAGKSYDYLLATAFEEPGNNNLYLKEEIIKALRLAADGEIGTLAFANAMEVLNENLPRLQASSPVAQLILELQNAAEAEVES